MLWARREQVEEFCRRQGLTWRTDHTNVDTDYTRNFIRHELLPLVRQRLNPRADEAILRLAESAALAEEVLVDLAGDLLQRATRKVSAHSILLRLLPLRKAPPLVASMALRMALRRLGAPEQALSSERFADAASVIAGTSPAVDLPGGIHLCRAGRDVQVQCRHILR
jgi:tRNA(Ile)-lysidine synthase